MDDRKRCGYTVGCKRGLEGGWYVILLKKSIFLPLATLFTLSSVCQITTYTTNHHFSFSVERPFMPISEERVQQIQLGKEDLAGNNAVKLQYIFSIGNNDYPNIQVSFQSWPSIKDIPFTGASMPLWFCA